MLNFNMKKGALALGLMVAATSAQSAESDYLSTCSEDIQAFCAAVVPGSGRLASCLYAHSATLSDACFIETEVISTQLEMFFDLIVSVTAVCQSDAEKFCSDATAGGGARFSCLRDNQSSLGKECAAKLEELKR